MLALYNYCIYRIKSVDEHGVHSPFVFDLVTNVIYNYTAYYSFKGLEKFREQLLNAPQTAQIAREQKGAKYSQLLFRLVNNFQPKTVLEIGASVGIDTAYLATANSKIKILSIREVSAINNSANEFFKELKLKNVELIIGNINETLPRVINQHEQLDVVYVNGKNTSATILNWFYQCLAKANESSVFVFSNMHDSSEQEMAWMEIKNNERVRVTVDLFYLGLVFFRKEQVKQHFLIRF
jgi:predicted O-methyltransferase YrrM